MEMVYFEFMLVYKAVLYSTCCKTGMCILFLCVLIIVLHSTLCSIQMFCNVFYTFRCINFGLSAFFISVQ